MVSIGSILSNNPHAQIKGGYLELGAEIGGAILSNLRTKPHSARFGVKMRAGKCCYKTMGCALTCVKK
jgi:hypothetical protein